MSNQDPQIDFDQPLRPETAIKNDKLSRKTFAESAVAALRRISSSAGFVLSIEGAWGSGKTSTLAMIEELLFREPELKRPVIVHFNPWLVGERDALLRQYFSSVSSALKLSDHAKDGKKVAKELKSYAKAFDVLKLIPGAEPWASLVKSVVESVGDATNSIAEYKTPDIEQRKQSVEAALRKYSRPIIVFIDDIDRLFPLEVFEMVRIIKAVGDLPHIGYVLAWDPAYVSSALKSANVPQSESYLDKVVQVRMPLPSLSLSAKFRLINDAMETLHPNALKSYFRNGDDRLKELYFAGLREILEQPRDVTRVFNTVSIIEPGLRGEVVLSDIVGLAALMVKAPPVFEALRKNPQWFVGELPGNKHFFEKKDDIIKAGLPAQKDAISACAMPAATQQLVHFLFPPVAEIDNGLVVHQVVDVEGHLAHPGRLLIALQQSISPSDVSLVLVGKFLSHPEERESIIQTLEVDNCLEFMVQLGDLASSFEGQGITDLEGLCVSIARLVDKEPYLKLSQSRNEAFRLRAEDVAIRSINQIIQGIDQKQSEKIAQLVIEDGHSLSLAAALLRQSYFSNNQRTDKQLVAPVASKARLVEKFAVNVLASATNNMLWATSSPGSVLWILGLAEPSYCRKVFAAIKSNDPTLDMFALEFLKNSFDSRNGQTYALPKQTEQLVAYCPLDQFRKHAMQRVSDPSLKNPARAAWRSVVEDKCLYGKDGTESD